MCWLLHSDEMIKLFYTPVFLRRYEKLSEPLKEEIREKILVFKKNPRFPSLHTHKLKGRMQGSYSFSVNYRYRVVFRYDTPETVALLSVGNHDIYQ